MFPISYKILGVKAMNIYKKLGKYTSHSAAFFLAALFSSGAWAIVDCSESDFVAGPLNTIASDCTFGSHNNTEITSQVNSWMYGDWSEQGRFDYGGPATNFSVGAGSIGYDYSWSTTLDYSTPTDTLFVVKQASLNQGANWMAYLFEDLSSAFGLFNLDDDLHSNDFSHTRIYTRPSVSVPEIDGAQTGIALCLLFALVSIVREKKIKP